MKKEDLAAELATRCNFYKKNMRLVVNELEKIIIEHFETAEFGADSELHLAPGVVLKGTRKPAGEAKDPRTGETIISPEKVIPSAVFKQSVRLKLYKKSKDYQKKKKG
jgi:nucleoid DNA-binding protein